jgi:2,5-diamino-6-(ribosylamino)-4(3H)-pyrimidinone 5'-phosphate reductase
MRPFVFINVAVTADGKMDTFERKGAAISSGQDRARVDGMRAGSDAVMVGGHTLLDEDPKLTIRSEALRSERASRGLTPDPMKVGIVTCADIRPDSNFLKVGHARRVIFTTEKTSSYQVELLRDLGVEVYIHPASRVDLVKALSTLSTLGVSRLMVEGGGTLNFELLRLGLVDELTMYIAPLILGGASAPTAAAGAGLMRSDAIPLQFIKSEMLDDGGVVIQYSLRVT